MTSIPNEALIDAAIDEILEAASSAIDTFSHQHPEVVMTWHAWLDLREAIEIEMRGVVNRLHESMKAEEHEG